MTSCSKWNCNKPAKWKVVVTKGQLESTSHCCDEHLMPYLKKRDWKEVTKEDDK